MHRINIIMDVDQEYFMENRARKPNRKTREKSIKINDDLFDMALREGLIEETEDGYVFIGDYKDLLAFKRRKKVK